LPLASWAAVRQKLRRDGNGATRWRVRIFQMLMVGLSASGVLLCLILLADGHAHLALRVLTGAVVLVTGLLLVV
jgi:hypothetical protein